MDEFGITSFGVSVTTLEEVFMKVGEGAEKTVDDLYVRHSITHLTPLDSFICVPCSINKY